MKQQQQPSCPVLIEPDSDVEETPRKQFKLAAPLPPLSTSKTSLLKALKVLQNLYWCQLPDEVNPLLMKITRKLA
jgi:hypothetical protein